MCRAADALFDATRTSVWLLDRRRRQLVLSATSNPRLERRTRVSTDDAAVPAVQGLRESQPSVTPGSATGARRGPTRVLVPLKGRRRAIGTIVIEGVTRGGWNDADVLIHAREFGLEMSVAVENVQLLHDVIQSRHELDNTFNSIADLVAVCDAELRLTQVNQAFAERVGLPRETLADRPIGDFVGSDIRQWVAALHTTRDRAIVPTRETEDPVLDGTFSVTLSRVVSHGAVPAGVVLVARDVSERARLETEQADLRVRLAQSEKLAALGQFVAGIAHELNNPLQAVMGHVELLNATAALPPDVRRDFRTVTREAERAANIVRNLLVFAGSRTLNKRRFSVNAVVTRAVTIGRDVRTAARITVITKLDSAMPRIAGEPLLVQQAILNLLLNAEHAVRGVETRRIEVSTRYRTRAKTVAVGIRDSGPGIADEALPHLFEPFYTTKDVGQGTGLGLAIAYGIIREHGGEIAASNDPRGGAVFTITLPVSRAARDKTDTNSLK